MASVILLQSCEENTPGLMTVMWFSISADDCCFSALLPKHEKDPDRRSKFPQVILELFYPIIENANLQSTFSTLKQQLLALKASALWNSYCSCINVDRLCIFGHVFFEIIGKMCFGI